LVLSHFKNLWHV